MLTIPIKLLTDTAILPTYAHDGDAGMDMCADYTMRIEPQERGLVPTGIALAIPAGYEGQLRPRSGIAYKHGITVLNAPGTIDSHYRGEVQVLLYNTSKTPFEIRRGMRIAQLVIAPVIRAEWQPVTALDATERGANGFGSTGDMTS